MVNKPRTDGGLRELALFAGAGGGILGGKLLGWRTVCAVEFDEHARNVLVARQNDGCLEPFPIWDDVRTFDGKPWRGIVDVVSGGFPCQDISSAGGGAGIEGERSGLWGEMRRIIGDVRPEFALIENSPMLTVRGGVRVVGDLAELGYDARWGVVGAVHAGLPHVRRRIWIVAHDRARRRRVFSGWPNQVRRDMGNNISVKSQIDRFMEELERKGAERQNGDENRLPSYLCRVDDELALNVDRLARIGNGQCPDVVRLAWNILSGQSDGSCS